MREIVENFGRHNISSHEQVRQSLRLVSPSRASGDNPTMLRLNYGKGLGAGIMVLNRLTVTLQCPGDMSSKTFTIPWCTRGHEEQFLGSSVLVLW